MNKKPALIAGLVGLAVVLLTIVGLILPKASAVKSKQNDFAAAQTEHRSLQTQLAQLEADRVDAPKDRRRLQKLETEIPATADLPGLVRILNATADDTNLDWMSVSPGQPSPNGSLTVIPIQLTLAGGFFAIDQYLHKLETMPRINTVSSLQLTAGPEGVPQLQVSVTANFFTTDATVGQGTVPDLPVGTAQATPAPTSTPSVIGG